MLSVHISAPSLSGKLIFVHIVATPVAVFHIEVAREVAVVVRTRVCGVVPVKGRVTVLSGPVEESHAGLKVLKRIGGVFEDEHRLVGAAYTGVADLAVLITPVGVVHIVAELAIFLHHIINFLCGSVLRAS